jgi:hypothetical protein
LEVGRPGATETGGVSLAVWMDELSPLVGR